MLFRKYLLAFIFLLTAVESFADKYPRNYLIDIIHYKFEIGLSDSTDEITGMASITLLFKSIDIKEVRLDFIKKTAARSGKGMVVESVAYNEGIPSYNHQNDVLWITLLNKPEKNKLYTFVIKYRGIPADGLRIGATRYGDRSFFSDNWPNKARHWFPAVDHPYEKATSEFIVTAPSIYQVISNGLLMEESDIGNGWRLTHWKQSVPVSCWLYALGVAEFAVQRVGAFESKPIQTWVYPKDREAGFHDFAEPTGRVLQFFSGYIGPFVYEKLANVQVASVAGGMEASSSIFYTETLVNGKADTRLRNVVIHEIAHQWFGNAVTESTWDDVWLSEGFATYFTLLFQENEYGYTEYLDGLKKARKVVLDYYEKDTAYSIIADRTAETGAVTNIITYQKGAWVLHMLRDIVGHEKFKAGIQSYYRKYMNANATTSDFICEMEKASGIMLQTFFDQWLYKPDVLRLSCTWKYDAPAGELVIHARQTQTSKVLYESPVEFEITEGENSPSRIVRFTIKDRSAEFRTPCSNKPILIRPDPRTVLLADIDIKEKTGN